MGTGCEGVIRKILVQLEIRSCSRWREALIDRTGAEETVVHTALGIVLGKVLDVESFSEIHGVTLALLLKVAALLHAEAVRRTERAVKNAASTSKPEICPGQTKD